MPKLNHIKQQFWSHHLRKGFKEMMLINSNVTVVLQHVALYYNRLSMQKNLHYLQHKKPVINLTAY